MASFIHTAPSILRLTRAYRTFHASSVPVLMFHGVLPRAGESPFNSRGMFVSPEKLRSFLERFARIFRIVSMEEFLGTALNGKPLRNAALVTFDDGYRNLYLHAYPALKKMGLPFTVFVSTGFVDTDDVMPWDVLNYAFAKTAEKVLPKGALPNDSDIGTPGGKTATLRRLKESLRAENVDRRAELIDRICEDLRIPRDGPAWNDVLFLSSAEIREMADGGVAFGGHTVTHPILSRESDDRIRREVRECKHALESMTGRAVRVFAYPRGARGDFNDAVKRELKDSGFAAAFATIHGLHRPGDDLFEIRRIGVDDRWSYAEFETRASGVLKAFRR